MVNNTTGHTVHQRHYSIENKQDIYHIEAVPISLLLNNCHIVSHYTDII